MALDHEGNLVLSPHGSEIRLHKPVVYQELNGQRKATDGHIVQKDKTWAGFHAAARDRSRPLVIDPVLTYSTLLGGGGFDKGSAIAVDTSCQEYVTGQTTSSNSPTTSGVDDKTYDGGDVFLTKLNSTGPALVCSTYLGGNGQELGNGTRSWPFFTLPAPRNGRGVNLYLDRRACGRC